MSPILDDKKRVPKENSVSFRSDFKAINIPSPDQPQGNSSLRVSLEGVALIRSGEGKDSETLPTTEQFKARNPYYTFENIILPQATRKNIDVLLSRIHNHKLLYETWELSKIDPAGRNKIVNFYGLPGTGKTLCAEALAHKLGKQIILRSITLKLSPNTSAKPVKISVSRFNRQPNKNPCYFSTKLILF